MPACQALPALRGLQKACVHCAALHGTALWTWTELYGLVLGRVPTNAMRCTQAPSPHRAQAGRRRHWPGGVRISAVPVLKIGGCFELHPHMHGILLCLPESNPLVV